jgi:hypothetical protein
MLLVRAFVLLVKLGDHNLSNVQLNVLYALSALHNPLLDKLSVLLVMRVFMLHYPNQQVVPRLLWVILPLERVY